MKIAVTAANGGLGSATIKALLRENSGHSIVGLARSPEKASHLGVEIRPGDYDNLVDLTSSLRDVDHLLFISSNDIPEKRLEFHGNVIDAATKAGVKKVIYTSIIGDPNQTAFGDIVASNRKTEVMLKASGLDYVICRNGLYLEPDLESLTHYFDEGKVVNSAADGRCGYTSRDELAYAYKHLLLIEGHSDQTYNTLGESITQQELVTIINQIYSTDLVYESIDADVYLEQRKKALGDFYGSIVGGIYESIRLGLFDAPSEFEKAAGRKHKTIQQLILEHKSRRAAG